MAAVARNLLHGVVKQLSYSFEVRGLLRLSPGFLQHPLADDKTDNLLHTDTLLEVGEYPGSLRAHAVGIRLHDVK